MLKKKCLLTFLKGIAMGAADVVPGVSGGTIAFISGIYETLIQSLKSLNLQSLRLLFSKGFNSFWQAIHGAFLLPLFLGIGLSVVSLSRLINGLLETKPVLIWSFFFGLILASVFFVWRQIGRHGKGSWVAMALGAALAYLISIAQPVQVPESYPFLCFSGFVAILAMMLPGISGAFILVLIGSYEGLLEILNGFLEALTNMNAAAAAVNGAKLGAFAIGALLGLGLFSRLLSWLLKRFKDRTLALLTGFMIGSLNKVWPWKETLSTRLDAYGRTVPLIQKNVSPLHYTDGKPALCLAVGLALAGFLTIFILERCAARRDV